VIEELIEEYAQILLVGTVLPLGVGAICGLSIGILQAATQLQEQAIGYLLKLVAVGVVVWVGGDPFITAALQLFARSLAAIARLGG